MVDRSGEKEMKVFGDPLKIMWENLILDFVVKNFLRKLWSNGNQYYRGKGKMVRGC